MRSLKLAALAVMAILALPSLARADVETVDRNGIRWRWIKGERCVEEQVVSVPGHWEVRRECVTEPGRWETRTRQVWRPRLVWETRIRTIPGTWTGSFRHPPRTIEERVQVDRGCFETVSEQVWCPPVTRWVDRNVWIPERCERRQVVVDRPGHWVRVCEPAPACEPCEPCEPRVSARTPLPVPVRRIPVVVPPCDGSEQVIIRPIGAASEGEEQIYDVGPDLRPRRRGPNW